MISRQNALLRRRLPLTTTTTGSADTPSRTTTTDPAGLPLVRPPRSTVLTYTASRSISLVQQPVTIGKAELDSHADTCCLGENCLVIHDTEQIVSVMPFEVKIVTAAVAYDCPATRNVFVLFFHQALHIPDLQKHLLCPNQLRHNQVLVNETPLLYIPPDQRDNSHHSIIFQQPHPILHIPLSLNGTTSYFDTRIPTWEEVNNPDAIHHFYHGLKAVQRTTVRP